MRTRIPSTFAFSLLIAAGLLFFASSGCYLDFGEWGTDGFEDDASNNRVTEASLQGELGPAAGLNHAATETEVDAYSNTAVRTTVARSNDAAMTVLTVYEENLDLPELREGQQITVYDSRNPAASRTNADLLGCAGPSPGVWSYDRHADDLVVLVERRRYNPRVLTYSYIGDFEYFDAAASRTRVTTISGSFDVHVD